MLRLEQVIPRQCYQVDFRDTETGVEYMVIMALEHQHHNPIDFVGDFEAFVECYDPRSIDFTHWQYPGRPVVQEVNRETWNPDNGGDWVKFARDLVATFLRDTAENPQMDTSATRKVMVARVSRYERKPVI